MFINIKASAIAAGTAFFLSFLMGIIRGAALLIVLIRALVFAGIFFVIFGGIYILIRQFLPELLSGEDTEPILGSNVDISLEDPEDEAAAGFFAGDDQKISGEGEDSAGPEGRDASGNPMGLDQNGEDDYTNSRKEEVNSSNSGVPPGESAALPPDSGSVDILPDLDSMERTFASSANEGAEESADYTSVKQSSTKSKSNTARGDYNPKDLASALQTILKREKG
ncbi:MAG: hypothetical protein LBP43_03970 [Treponema sp.]|nr:hypothetical protein [Treponema sp.]